MSDTPETDDAFDAFNRQACGLAYVRGKMAALERQLAEVRAERDETEARRQELATAINESASQKILRDADMLDCIVIILEKHFGAGDPLATGNIANTIDNIIKDYKAKGQQRDAALSVADGLAGALEGLLEVARSYIPRQPASGEVLGAFVAAHKALEPYAALTGGKGKEGAVIPPQGDGTSRECPACKLVTYALKCPDPGCIGCDTVPFDWNAAVEDSNPPGQPSITAAPVAGQGQEGEE